MNCKDSHLVESALTVVNNYLPFLKNCGHYLAATYLMTNILRIQMSQSEATTITIRCLFFFYVGGIFFSFFDVQAL